MGNKMMQYEEKILKAANGMGVLILNLLLIIGSICGIGFNVFAKTEANSGVALLAVCILYLALPSWLLFIGIKVLKPNEALVLTLFGKYVGTLKGEGMFFVNPFCTAVNPAAEKNEKELAEAISSEKVSATRALTIYDSKALNKKLSLKTMTLNNNTQKINDLLGNPIIIGIAVIWRIENTAKAVFNVDNFREFLSIQCDTALRNTVRLYPYDIAEDDGEKSLRGSSQEIAAMLRDDIQQRVESAGLKIEEARITHLSYAPEIAAVMLQRQQASAIIDARKMIVEGAVGMVEMALGQLSSNNVCELDDERRAQMVSNLMVVLCSGKDAQPIVNSGSIY